MELSINFSIGKLTSKYMILEILCYIDFYDACLQLLWNLSKSSRRYLKQNHLQMKNRIKTKRKPLDIDPQDILYHRYLL